RIDVGGGNIPARVVLRIFAGEADVVEVGIGVGDVVHLAVASDQTGGVDVATQIVDVATGDVDHRAGLGDHFLRGQRDAAAIQQQRIDGLRYLGNIAAHIRYRRPDPGQTIRSRTGHPAVDGDRGTLQDTAALQG